MAMHVQAEVVLVPPGSIPPPALEKLRERFRTARLRALQEYAYAFVTTYEKESLFGDKVWVKRLQSPDAKHFVAICPSASSQSINGTDKLTENEWKGMIVLLGPRVLSPDGSESMAPWKPFAGLEKASPAAWTLADQEIVYLATSMFVLPEARGKGLATKLIEASVDLLLREAVSLKARTVNIGLLVQETNKGAIKCYEKCGFKFLPDDSSMEAFTEKGKVVGMNRIIELSYEEQS